MDFVLDYISVNTFWTILFTIHALLAVALLGALTHQAVSVLLPVRQAAGDGGFILRFRAVHSPGYATAHHWLADLLRETPAEYDMPLPAAAEVESVYPNNPPWPPL